MAVIRKPRTRLTNAEFEDLDNFLSIAQESIELIKNADLLYRKETVLEIKRLREKLHQIKLQQKKKR